MRCDCCLRRKGPFESYALVKTGDGSMNLCPACNDLLYKIRDDANEKKQEKFKKHVKELEEKGKKGSQAFVVWKDKYLKDQEMKFEEKTAEIELKAAVEAKKE